MITYIDSTNKQDYTILFNKASAKLGLTPIVKEVTDSNGNITYEYYRNVQQDGRWTEMKLDPAKDLDANHNLLIDGKVSKGITSLNDYFQHITDLASLAIGDGRSGTDPYFLRLPLDEPYFEINANTREITVPSALSQVGVVGDKYAEVVFFKIDRYFDAVDLGTRQIYIEWELPDGTKGVSRDFLKDTQSEKDKIIFGWLIGDELTKQEGAIRFAVRFVEWNHGTNETSVDKANSGTEIAYSFSSLPAQIQIVDSLHYSLYEDGKDALMIDTNGQAGTLKFYLEDSTPDGTSETAPELAAKPVYILDLNGTLVDDVYENDLNDEGQLELDVEAYSPDSGNISYMFGRRDQKDGGTKGIVAQIKFVPIELTAATRGENTIYYKKKANGIFEIASKDELDTALADGGKATYYERVAYIIVAGPGYYFAQARNSVTGKKAASQNSHIVHVPEATAPVVNSNMPDHFVIKQQNYSLSVDNSVDQSLRENSMVSNIKIASEGTIGNASILLGSSNVGPTFSAEKTKGLTYTWFKATKADMSDKTILKSGLENTYEVTEPGYYSVEVDNFYNNSHKSIDDSAAGVIRVTNMPIISASAIHFADWEKSLSTGINTSIIVDEMEHDHLTYQWYKVTADSTDMDPVAAGDMAEDSGELTFVNGEASIPFKPLRAGNYYFILTNELNGAEVYFSSALEPSMGIISVSTGGNPTPSLLVVDNENGLKNAVGSEAGTVELNSDISLTSSLSIPAGKKLTVDLRNHTLNTGANSISSARDVTIKGGSIVSDSDDSAISITAGTLTLDNTNITSSRGFGIKLRSADAKLDIESGTYEAKEGVVSTVEGGTVVINGGTFKAKDNGVIVTDRTTGNGNYDITVNSGRFEGGVESDGHISSGVVNSNSGRVTINGGTFTANAPVIARGGTTVLNGGDFVATGNKQESGKVGDSLTEVHKGSAVVYDTKSAYPDAAHISVRISAHANLTGDIEYILPEGEDKNSANLIDERTNAG